MEISSAAKVGMITLVAIIFLGLIFSQVGKWKDREAGYPIMVIFNQVSGLQPEAKVRLAGVNVGKVKEILILPDYKIKVLLSITYHNLKIEQGSKFNVIGSVWGDKWIEIYPPLKQVRPGVSPTPAPTMAPGEVVVGEPPVSLEQFLVEGQGLLKDFKKAIANINSLVGDPRVQSDFKGTLSNFNVLSKNLKTASLNADKLVQDVRYHVDNIGGQLGGFSSAMKRIAQLNESDIRVIVKNLKETSHSLNLAMASIKKLTTNEQLSDDIVATIASLRKTGEEISGIAYDIHTLTSDPQIKEDLKQVIHEARQTVNGANMLFKKLNNMLGGEEKQSRIFEIDAENEWVKTNGLSSANVNAVLFPQGSFNFKLGADSVGHGTLYNVQLGKKFKFITPRAGIIRSELGIGFDTNFSKLFNISLDAYDTRYPKVDLLGRFNIGGDFYLLGGSRNIFDTNGHYTIFGAGKKF